MDNDSIDLIVPQRGGNGTVRSPRVELQLKCTGQDVINNGNLHFPLKLKNYDDLRAEDVLVPRILVVLCVPDDLTDADPPPRILVFTPRLRRDRQYD